MWIWLKFPPRPCLQCAGSWITLRFRGREITHQELGLSLLARIRDELADLIIVEQFPKLEGRQMVMMIAPGRKKAAPKASSEPVQPIAS